MLKKSLFYKNHLKNRLTRKGHFPQVTLSILLLLYSTKTFLCVYVRIVTAIWLWNSLTFLSLLSVRQLGIDEEVSQEIEQFKGTSGKHVLCMEIWGPQIHTHCQAPCGLWIVNCKFLGGGGFTVHMHPQNVNCESLPPAGFMIHISQLIHTLQC